MTDDPRDRILDQALGRVLAPEPEGTETDEVERILAAWDRGVSQVRLDELEDPLEESTSVAAPPGASTAPRPRLSRVRGVRLVSRIPLGVGALAAAAAAVALVVLWPRAEDAGGAPSGAPRVLASRTVDLLRGSETLQRSEALAGDVVLAWDAGVTCTEPGGSEALVEAGGVVRIGTLDTNWGVRRGKASIQNGSNAALLIETPYAGFELAPEARLTLVVHDEEFRGELAREEYVDWMRSRGADWSPPVCEVQAIVERGHVELVWGDRREHLFPGENRTLAAIDGYVGPLNRARREAMKKRFEELIDIDILFAAGLDLAAGERAEALAELLFETPQYWYDLRSRTRKVMTEPDVAPMLKGALIEFLARDRTEVSLGLARDLWLTQPDRFELHHILAFAERGAFEFEREVNTMTRAAEVPEPGDMVLFAAHLAFRQKDAGVGLLRAFLDADAKPAWTYKRPPTLALVAACALDDLGLPEYWEEEARELRGSVENALAVDDLALAGALTGTAVYLGYHRAEGTSPGLAFLETRARAHAEQHGLGLETHAEIRRALDDAGL